MSGLKMAEEKRVDRKFETTHALPTQLLTNEH